MQHSTQAPASHSARADIQGLRALAVMAVVANHLIGWPSGGFVGVDVFFVISGFLITRLMLRERERTGRISFVGFYRRRVRRIVPAAALVLIVTVLATRFLLATERFSGIVSDALAALFFGANWRFAITGTDYFEANGPVSPLQHYWSLSVEEQFYAVWPVVLLLAIAIVGGTRARDGHARRAAGGAIAVIGIASLAWAIVETSSSPTVAYFSTFARAWELAAGAGLAIAEPWIASRLPSWLRPVLAWAGFLTIVVSLFTTAEAPGFPAPGAAVAVFGAVLVLGGGIGQTSSTLLPLTNPVARYLGDTSYSLYLWHFPVIVIFGPYLEYLLGQSSPSVLSDVIVVAVALVLAFASYHLVESPVRRSRWLLPSREPSRHAYRRRARRPYVVLGAASFTTCAVIVAALGFASASEHVSEPVNALPGAISVPSASASASASGAVSAQKGLSAQIRAALQAKSWPTLSNVGEEALPGNAGACGGATVLPASECTFGDAGATHTALLVGDSIAQAYIPGLVKVVGTGDWKIHVMSMYACPFIDVPIGAKAAQAALCETRKAAEYRAIQDERPDLVIIANTVLRGHDPTSGETVTQTAWDAGFASMIRTVHKTAKQFVVLPPLAPDKDVASCHTAYSKPSACVSIVSDTAWPVTAAAEQAATRRAGGVFIDTRAWFCDAAGECPAFVGHVLVRKDQAHPTVTYIASIAGVMRESFERAGVLDPASPSASATPTVP